MKEEIMNDKIRNHLINYCKSKGWPHARDDELIEAIREGEEVWSGDEDEHRHWIEYTVVVEINGMFIQFGSAKGAGDQGIYDAGWEFDENTICEVQPQKITTTIYKPIK